MKSVFILFIIFIITGAPLAPAMADYTPLEKGQRTLTLAERMALARQFVLKVGKGLENADRKLKKENQKDGGVILADGEELMMRLRLSRRLSMDAPVYGMVDQGTILISLLDFVTALDFPIEIDADQGTANGWYIREKKTFSLDMKTGQVETENGVFPLSDRVRQETGDILVPIAELSEWFGFGLKPEIATQDIFVNSPVPLPIEEKMARGKRQFRSNRVRPPELPLLEEEAKAIDVPFVDISTASSYRKSGQGGEAILRNNASVRTKGDFAFGTLETQSQFNNEDILSNVRVNYKKESLEPELLGPLKARRYELGDITSRNVTLDNLPSAGVGARVTNIHPLRTSLRPSTDITGTAFPGWDAELYRNNQIISIQTVGDDGTYNFANVDLFNSDNNFKVVLYGPQGEVREEEIQIPVDSRRLSEMGSAYDVSLTAQKSQTYRSQDSDDEDLGTPSLSAIYEVPVGDKTALTAGLEAGQKDGEMSATVHSGVSTTMGGTLFNFDTAVDNNAEMAAQLVARRDFGHHQLRNEIKLNTDGYGADMEDRNGDGIVEEGINEVFSEKLNLNGPLPVGIGKNPRYNLALGYGMDSDGENEMKYSAGFNTSIKRVAFNQQFDYTKSSTATEDALNSLTTISGRMGQNRLRLNANYEIKPDSHLESVLATVRRNVTKKLELQAGIERQMQQKLTEGRLGANWDAGFMHISPSVSYNTDSDLEVTLNTRFGMAHDPASESIRSFDRGITNNGGISAFVFLDKDGDGEFNGEDEPLPDVIVKAPQNSGRDMTDEDGRVFLSRLRPMKTTDVIVDESSLQDPYWVSGFKGVSIIPREGHVTTLNFPIHMAGEMDGTIYARDKEGEAHPLRNIKLGLYNAEGQKIYGTVSGMDGFYLISKIAPGSYYLVIDDPTLSKEFSRPLPQPVRIGYEGTIIYANNLYLEEGKPDVALAVLAKADIYADSAEQYNGRTLMLNLGSYKSRLAMGLAWFKIRTLSGGAIKDTDLMQKPSESHPEKVGGNYVLRLSPRSNNLEHAYRQCAQIVKVGSYCAVEILPGGLEQKVAAK